MTDWKFDLRVIERFLRSGEISEKEYQNFLKEIQDLDGKYEEADLEELLPAKLVEKLSGKSEEKGEGKGTKGKGK